MNAWWQNLNTREKRLVILAAVLLGTALLWLVVAKPLLQHNQLLKQDIEDARGIQAQLQKQAGQISQLNRNGAAKQQTFSGSLHNQVIKTLKQHQLDGSGTSSESNGADSVTLKLEAKPFDALIQALAQLEGRYAIRITRMKLEPADKTGTVDADITLER